MLKKFLLLVHMMVLLLVSPGIIQAEGQKTPGLENASENTADQDPIVFPVVFQRATGDSIISLAADEKGTIIAVTYDYINVTHDFGKTWTTSKTPTSDMYSVMYAQGKFYLSKMHVNKEYEEIPIYVSDNGDQWSILHLTPDGAPAVTIVNVQYVNGTYILIAKQYRTENGSILFTSADGMVWSETANIPSTVYFLTWNGSVYTAYGSGYIFYNKPATFGRNQFLVDSKDKRYAEMIVYSSNNLQDWTMQSGQVKSGMLYKFVVNDIPSTNYYYDVEKYTADGVITLYDYYGNILTSKDGKSFTIQSRRDLFPTNYHRTPTFKAGKNYIIFTQYWHSPGVIRSKALVSTDRAKWKQINLDKNVPNSMDVIQANDNTLVGYGDDGRIAISNNGIDWKKIR
ncbi:hypothetical protein PAE9249_04245 [Paenibacillus sp. CECT 9249]|nr:hypothetical protein PAE9249_04245 [Paenibacillus sp. CECT 9249]